jgi:hypothetical protein
MSTKLLHLDRLFQAQDLSIAERVALDIGMSAERYSNVTRLDQCASDVAG